MNWHLPRLHYDERDMLQARLKLLGIALKQIIELARPWLLESLGAGGGGPPLSRQVWLLSLRSKAWMPSASSGNQKSMALISSRLARAPHRHSSER